MDNIQVPLSAVSVNAQLITDLADAVNPTDALNLQTGDNRYYLNTVSLDNIVLPVDSVSMNSQKLTSLADATNPTDALNQ